MEALTTFPPSLPVARSIRYVGPAQESFPPDFWAATCSPMEAKEASCFELLRPMRRETSIG
jgi:hypothetical protein